MGWMISPAVMVVVVVVRQFVRADTCIYLHSGSFVSYDQYHTPNINRIQELVYHMAPARNTHPSPSSNPFPTT